VNLLGCRTGLSVCAVGKPFFLFCAVAGCCDALPSRLHVSSTDDVCTPLVPLDQSLEREHCELMWSRHAAASTLKRAEPLSGRKHLSSVARL